MNEIVYMCPHCETESMIMIDKDILNSDMLGEPSENIEAFGVCENCREAILYVKEQDENFRVHKYRSKQTH